MTNSALFFNFLLLNPELFMGVRLVVANPSIIALTGASFQKLTGATASVDTTGGWSNANSEYTVSVSGLYAIWATARIDDLTPSFSYGMNVGATVTDSPSFLWSNTLPNRNGLANNRIQVFNVGDVVKQFMYSDNNAALLNHTFSLFQLA